MELTGNYARNEVNPLTDDCYFFVGRATSADGIRMWCDNACRVRGAKYARRISRDVMDGSQSPRETLHAIILSSPPELGGLGLERPLLNVPLQLSSQERLLIKLFKLRIFLFKFRNNFIFFQSFYFSLFLKPSFFF